MTLEETRYDQVMQRLDNLNKIDLDERISYLEKHVTSLLYVCNSINKAFSDGIKIKVDEQALNVINPLKEILGVLRSEAVAFKELRKEIQSDSVIGTLKFIAKSLHELTQEVHSIKENGVKKAIHLDLTMDGYEMVRKKPTKANDPIPEQKVDPEHYVKELLKLLPKRKQEVIIHRYGLFGEKEKSLVATGKILGISGERVRATQNSALRMFRHPKRKDLVLNLTHLDLRIDILGE
jgi:DNA-binding CsgD family transcriptional regulator